MIKKMLPDFCSSGRKISSVDGIIIHHFSCSNVDPENQFDVEACFNLMVDLNLPRIKRKHYLKEDRHAENRMYASAHLFIDRGGEIYQLMDFDAEAHHSGKAMMHGRAERKSCNPFTLGIELIGTYQSGFTDEQYQSLSIFCADQMAINDFPHENIMGHDQVRWEAIEAGVANSRHKKYDPSGLPDGTGDNFDWDRFIVDVEAQVELGLAIPKPV